MISQIGKRRKHFLTRFIGFVITVVIVCILIPVIVLNLSARKKAKLQMFDAIENNDRQTVIEVLDRYPNLVGEDYYVFIPPIDAGNSSPLCQAIIYCDIEMIKLLVERGANINASTSRIYPLNKALQLGKYDIAWYLIKNGANLSVKSSSWKESVAFSVLAQKIDHGDTKKEQEQFELLRYILEQGVSLAPPIGSHEGIKTLLGLAAYQNNALIVKYLLNEQIYDVDEIVNPTYTQKTALIVAVEQQSYSVLEVLLDYGADKTIKDIDGKTAMDYAIELNDEKLIAILSE